MQKLILVPLFILLFGNTFAQLDTLYKDFAQHYGIVAQGRGQALYNFQDQEFITPLAPAWIIRQPYGFYLYVRPHSQDFILYFLNNGHEIHSDPQTSLTVYQSDGGHLGVSGQMIYFDKVAAFGNHAFDVGHWYAYGIDQHQFAISSTSSDYHPVPGYRRVLLRINKLQESTLLVENAYQHLAHFRVYNFATQKQVGGGTGVLQKVGIGTKYDLYRFKQDSVEQNYYGDIFMEAVWVPDRIVGLTFSDREGQQTRRAFRKPEESLEDSFYYLDAQRLPDPENDSFFAYNTRSIRKGPTQDRKLSIKAASTVVYDPNEKGPILYLKNDTLYLEESNKYAYQMAERAMRRASWASGDTSLTLEVKGSHFLVVNYQEKDQFPPFLKIPGKSGIYDTHQHKWMVPPEMDAVAYRSGRLYSLKLTPLPMDSMEIDFSKTQDLSELYTGVLTVRDTLGKVLKTSSQYPLFKDLFAVELQLDSLRLISREVAIGTDKSSDYLLRFYQPNHTTIPTVALVDSLPADGIPLIGMNPGSYLTIRKGIKRYAIYTTQSPLDGGFSRFDFVSDAPFSGFNQSRHPDSGLEIAHDEAEPYLPDVISFVAQKEAADPTLWGASMLIGVDQVSPGRYLVFNNQLRTQSYTWLGPTPPSRFGGPVAADRSQLPHFLAGSYRSGYYDAVDHKWLLPPRYERFIFRYDGITAIEKSDYMGKEIRPFSLFGPSAHKVNYVNYTFDLQWGESVDSLQLEPKRKESLLYPTYQVDTVLRKPPTLPFRFGNHQASRLQIYKTGNQYGYMELGKGEGSPVWFMRQPDRSVRNWHIGPTYPLIGELDGVSVTLTNDSLQLLKRKLPLLPLTLEIKPGNWDDESLQLTFNEDTVYYDGWRNFFKNRPDAEGPLPDELDEFAPELPTSTCLRVSKNVVAFANAPLSFSNRDLFNGDQHAFFPEYVTSSSNNSALWVKDGQGWTNIIGFHSNLICLDFGYFQYPPFIEYQVPPASTELRKPGTFYDLDGNPLPTFDMLNAYWVLPKKFGAVFYFHGGMGVLDPTGSVLGMGVYQYFKQEEGRVFLGEMDVDGQTVLDAKGEPAGLWINIPAKD